MPIDEDPFSNSQNLKPKMMEPEMCRFKTNIAWETGLKGAVGKEALIYPLAEIN